MDSKKVKIIIVLLLIASALIVFWQVQDHDFITYDDPIYVTNNSYVKTGLNIESLKWAFTTNYAGFWHPLTWLSLMLDYELYGVNPGGYHWTNLILHVANTVLLFLSLNLMSGAIWRCAFVAALFAVHPLHVESVAWVSERKDVLSTLFWMLTMISYTYYIRKRTLGRYVLVFSTFTLGMMAKPMLMTLPFVLILLDYWPLKRFELGKTDSIMRKGWDSFKRCIKLSQGEKLYLILIEKIPFIVLSVIFSIVTFTAEKQFGAISSLKELSIAERIYNAIVSYSLYIIKMFCPLNLAFFYPHPGSWPLWEIGISCVFLIAFTYMSMKCAKTYPYGIVGWLWYLVTLIPVIGLIQVGSHAMADRYTYIPLIGIFITTSWAISDFAVKKPFGKLSNMVLMGLPVVSVLVLMICAYFQVGYWRESRILYRHAVAVTHANYAAHNNLAAALGKLGQDDVALSHLYESVRIKPDFSVANYNLGLAMFAKGRDEEALGYYNKALQFRPDYIKVYYDIEATLLRMGKLQEIVGSYQQALSKNPQNVEIKNKLGISEARIGLHEEAARQFREVVRIQPNFAGAYNNLAMELLKLKQYNEAIKNFRRALQIKPEYANAHYYLAFALKKQGLHEEANKHFQKAVTINSAYKDRRFDDLKG